MAEKTRPIADGLFTESAEPALIGARCRGTGRYLFPHPASGASENYHAVNLSREGVLWSYTVQRFRPKSPPYAGPETFEPYAVGYIELPDQLIVEARLTEVDIDQLRCGQAMELTIIPFRTDPDGTIRTTFAFRPARRRT